MSTPTRPSVLVLGGGPDAERDVSIKSASAIARALRDFAGDEHFSGFDVRLEIIDRLDAPALAALPGQVIFPYLHGPWGEGGPLQDLLEADGRPYVGAGPRAARAAMDKLATKLVAAELGIATPPAWVVNPADPVCPTALPVIIKPVHEGSTIGLSVCLTRADFSAALQRIHAERAGGLVRTYMIEPKIGGARAVGAPGGARELTVGLIDHAALPIIEIRPRQGLYDYDAKYLRDDTEYLLDPPLPGSVGKKIARATTRLAKALGIRHIARADFLLDADATPWLLEINTTPGFTDHSLVPKAAAHAGTAMPALCARLVAMALRDARPPARGRPAATPASGPPDEPPALAPAPAPAHGQTAVDE